MDIVDHLVDPVTGAPIFPDLREWHGQVADYFCGITGGAGDECR